MFIYFFRFLIGNLTYLTHYPYKFERDFSDGSTIPILFRILLDVAQRDVYTVPLQLRCRGHRTRAGESEPKRYSCTFVFVRRLDLLGL